MTTKLTVSGSALCFLKFHIYVILKHFLIYVQLCLVYAVGNGKCISLFLQFHLKSVRDQTDSLSLTLAKITPQFSGSFSFPSSNYIFQTITTEVTILKENALRIT